MQESTDDPMTNERPRMFQSLLLPGLSFLSRFGSMRVANQNKSPSPQAVQTLGPLLAPSQWSFPRAAGLLRAFAFCCPRAPPLPRRSCKTGVLREPEHQDGGSLDQTHPLWNPTCANDAAGSIKADLPRIHVREGMPCKRSTKLNIKAQEKHVL